MTEIGGPEMVVSRIALGAWARRRLRAGRDRGRRSVNYEPDNHAFTARQVVAGWAVCLAIIGLALGMTSGRQAVPAADAASAPVAALGGRCPMSGVRLPRPAYCRTEPTFDPAHRLAAMRGAASPRIDHCG